MTVADIISFDNLRQEAEEKAAGRLRKSKSLAARKGIQEARRPNRCEKCSSPISETEAERKADTRRLRTPYLFCGSCLEEYIDFIDRLQGQGNPEYYWHNEIWLESWRRWIDYKSTLDRYIRSKEFTRLVREIELNTIDE
jgi:hypothetical protein